MDCSTPGFPVLGYLSVFAQIHVNRMILCHPLLLLPLIFPSMKDSTQIHFKIFLCDNKLWRWEGLDSLFPEPKYQKLNTCSVLSWIKLLAQESQEVNFSWTPCFSPSCVADGET